MRVRPGLVAAVLLAATPAAPADSRLDAARVEVFHDWREIGPDEVAPQSPIPAYCVGEGGWIVVDEEVVAGSAHVFVGFEGHGPFATRAGPRDEETGLALLRVHPRALEGRTCLPFVPGGSPPEAPPLVAGTPILDAQGRWVGVGAAGRSDRRLGKDAKGEWVGHERRRRATMVAGLDGLERRMSVETAVPPAEPVTVGSASIFARALRRASAPPPDSLVRYEAASGEGLRLELLTPASLDTLSRVDDGVYEPHGEFFRWEDHAGMWQPAVAVQSAPEFHWTPGSKAAAFGAAILMIPAILGGGSPPTFRAAWTSGKDRIDYVVERGGVAVAPSEAQVSCFDAPMNLLPPGHEKPESRVVRGCRNVAWFDPAAFEPGADVAIVVTTENGTRRRVAVAPATLERIAADFEPWRASLREAGPRPVPPRLRVLPPWEVLKVAREDAAAFRFFVADGSRIDIERRVVDGVSTLRVPVWRRHLAFWSRNSNPAGWLDVTPDAFVFTPLEERLREKGEIRIPREGTTATAGEWGILRLSRESGGGSFLPRFEGEDATGLPALPNRSERIPVTAWIVHELAGEKPVEPEP